MHPGTNTGLDISIWQLACQLVRGSPARAMPGDNDIGSNSCKLSHSLWNDMLKQSTRQMQPAHEGMNMFYPCHTLGMADDINRTRMAAAREYYQAFIL